MKSKSGFLLVVTVIFALALAVAVSASPEPGTNGQAVDPTTSQPADTYLATTSLADSRENLIEFSTAALSFSENPIIPYADGGSVYAADLDGDNDIDIVGASATTNEIAWWKNSGNSFATKYTISNNYDGANSVSAIDLDKDTHIDILGSASGLDEIAWWKNDGTPVNGGWSKQTIASNFDGARSAHAIDFDGDTDLDIVGAAKDSGEIAWWENDGTPENGGWTKHTVTQVFTDVGSIYAIDLNSDSFVDVVGVEPGEYFEGDGRVVWWQNDGTPEDGGWIQHVLSENFALAADVYATDVDGDLDIDILAVGAHESGFRWWENTGNNGFAVRSISSNVDYVHSVRAIDLDSDSDVDVIGSSTTRGIVWWENDGNQNFDEHIVSEHRTFALSPHVVDLDNDMDLDVIGSAAVDYRSDHSITWWKADSEEFVYIPAVMKSLAPPSPVKLYLHAQNYAPRNFLSTTRDDGTEFNANTAADDPAEWTMSLNDDLVGTEYSYSIYANIGPYQDPISCDVEILLRKNGSDTILASWPQAFTIPTGNDIHYSSGEMTGIDPNAVMGDVLVLRIRPRTGYALIYTGDFFGHEVYSYINVPGSYP